LLKRRLLLLVHPGITVVCSLDARNIVLSSSPVCL
jgi:hypothetical protein